MKKSDVTTKTQRTQRFTKSQMGFVEGYMTAKTRRTQTICAVLFPPLFPGQKSRRKPGGNALNLIILVVTLIVSLVTLFGLPRRVPRPAFPHCDNGIAAR